VYPKALSAAEVQANYEALASRFVPGLHLNTSGVYVLVPTSKDLVSPYAAPDAMSNVNFPSAMQERVALAGCTVRIGGTAFLPGSRSAANITVNLYDNSTLAAAAVSKPASPNCTVTSYGFVDGVVTFTVKPTTNGTGRTLVVFVDTPGGGAAIIADSTGRTVSAFPGPVPVLLLDASDTRSYTGSGTTWTDMSGNGYNATISTPSSFSSAGGGSFLFPDAGVVQGNISASIFGVAHSLAVWIYRTTPGNVWGGLFSNNVTVNGASIIGFNYSAEILGVSRAGLDGTLVAGVNLGGDHYNKWIYAVVVYSGVTNGSSVTVYAYKTPATLLINNAAGGTGTLYWTMTTDNKYWVGQQIGTNYVSGRIAQVEVYNKALSAAEIQLIYDATKSRFGL
jgi:hypothetical protein